MGRLDEESVYLVSGKERYHTYPHDSITGFIATATKILRFIEAITVL